MDLVEADSDDVDVLAEYWFALASETERHHALNELAVDDPVDAEAGFERQLDRDDATAYLLVEDGATMGYLLLREGRRPSRTASRYADVVDLYVEPGSRGRGRGSEAVAAAKRIARENGAAVLEVSCEWDNDDARRFYERNGFAEKQVTYVQRIDDRED